MQNATGFLPDRLTDSKNGVSGESTLSKNNMLRSVWPLCPVLLFPPTSVPTSHSFHPFDHRVFLVGQLKDFAGATIRSDPSFNLPVLQSQPC